MIEIIDGADLRRMIAHGAAAIQSEKQVVNDLNVFPVPDGDTGTNMSLTIATAVDALAEKDPQTVEEVAQVTASAMLRGARGNSGVILSLLFRGVAKLLKGCTDMDGHQLALALSEGVTAAYGAVMKPAEGTILTVSRLAALRAEMAAEDDPGIEYVLEEAIKAGYEALADTINQNPVLQKAGVIDAGGKGFLLILDGMLAGLRGEPMPNLEHDGQAQRGKADFAALTDEEITFTFDTVYIVRKTVPCSLEPLRAYLNSIGDSLVIGEDDDAFKIHVHTDQPGLALTESQKYGTLELAKIENMRTQYEDMAAGRKPQSTDDLDMVEAALEAQCQPKMAPPEKAFGFVSVCAGEGLSAVFADLGVDSTVSGGQTMNPSTEDILQAVNATPAETVFVLPNNKNIIMAANQCIPLSENKRVIVVESTTIPQGVAAMLAFDPDSSAEDNQAAMTEAMAGVRTAQLTYAARDSVFEDAEIHAGDYLALLDGQLFGVSEDCFVLLSQLAAQAAGSGAEFVTLFCGQDAGEEEVKQAETLFKQICPDAEVSVLASGQPVYRYLISIE